MGARSNSNDESSRESSCPVTLEGVARIKDLAEIDFEAPLASNWALNEPSFCAEIPVKLAPRCSEGPSPFERARTRVSLPSRNVVSVGRSRGALFDFAARNMPRMMLPVDLSAS